MPLLPQDLVHKIEVGAGAGVVRMILAALALLALLFCYNIRCYRNFSVPEAMDQAQLARNIARGEGYTTKVIRPFSLFLIKRENQERLQSLSPEQKADLYRIKGPHPDIYNPPVYPMLLAGLMKAAPSLFDYDTSKDGASLRARGDLVIALFNQLLLLALAGMTYLLARRLFDFPVAILSAVLMLCSDLLLRFSISGLSTLLLLVLFMGLTWALVRLDAAAREAAPRRAVILGLGAGIGLLLGAGMLTRYSYGVLLLPVAGFVLACGGKWRVQAALIAAGVFALIVAPWIVRNLQVSGAPFGTAGYALIENSAYFSQYRLDRSLNPDLAQINLTPIWWRFFSSLRFAVVNDLPKIGGGWISAFFAAGLMFGFRNPAIGRLRYFLLASLPVLLVMQAVGRTAVSEELPDINGENLLVLLLPLIVIFGVSFFHTLLDQMGIGEAWLRRGVKGVFCLAMALPLAVAFLPPKVFPVAFPPYHPPSIQQVSRWMGRDDLIMSDIPWAVAWYGERQSILLTLDADQQFFELNDYIRPVRALYLTPASLDAKFLTQWVRGGTERSWGVLVLTALNKEELPPRFPLRKSIRLPEQLFLSDLERWAKPVDAAPDE